MCHKAINKTRSVYSAVAGMASSLKVEAMIRGYHQYKEISDAAIGKLSFSSKQGYLKVVS